MFCGKPKPLCDTTARWLYDAWKQQMLRVMAFWIRNPFLCNDPLACFGGIFVFKKATVKFWNANLKIIRLRENLKAISVIFWNEKRLIGLSANRQPKQTEFITIPRTLQNQKYINNWKNDTISPAHQKCKLHRQPKQKLSRSRSTAKTTLIEPYTILFKYNRHCTSSSTEFIDEGFRSHGWPSSDWQTWKRQSLNAEE